MSNPINQPVNFLTQNDDSRWHCLFFSYTADFYLFYLWLFYKYTDHTVCTLWKRKQLRDTWKVTQHNLISDCNLYSRVVGRRMPRNVIYFPSSHPLVVVEHACFQICYHFFTWHVSYNSFTFSVRNLQHPADFPQLSGYVCEPSTPIFICSGKKHQPVCWDCRIFVTDDNSEPYCTFVNIVHVQGLFEVGCCLV